MTGMRLWTGEVTSLASVVMIVKVRCQVSGVGRQDS
jgi:hypothetical protein